MPQLPRYTDQNTSEYTNSEYAHQNGYEFNLHAHRRSFKGDTLSEEANSKPHLGSVYQSDNSGKQNSNRPSDGNRCTCVDIKKDLDEMRSHLHRLESSMKEDIKLVLGLLRTKQRISARDRKVYDRCTSEWTSCDSGDEDEKNPFLPVDDENSGELADTKV